MQRLKDKILSLELQKPQHDVRPFLENPDETKYFDPLIMVPLVDQLA